MDQVFQAPPSLFILFQLFLPRLRLLRRHSLQEPSLSHGLGLEEEAESQSRIPRMLLNMFGMRQILVIPPSSVSSHSSNAPSFLSAWGIFRRYLSGPSRRLLLAVVNNTETPGEALGLWRVSSQTAELTEPPARERFV